MEILRIEIVRTLSLLSGKLGPRKYSGELSFSPQKNLAEILDIVFVREG